MIPLLKCKSSQQNAAISFFKSLFKKGHCSRAYWKTWTEQERRSRRQNRKQPLAFSFHTGINPSGFRSQRYALQQTNPAMTELHAFTVVGPGSIPGQETKILQVVWCSQKKKNTHNNKNTTKLLGGRGGSYFTFKETNLSPVNSHQVRKSHQQSCKCNN